MKHIHTYISIGSGLVMHLRTTESNAISVHCKIYLEADYVNNIKTALKTVRTKQISKLKFCWTSFSGLDETFIICLSCLLTCWLFLHLNKEYYNKCYLIFLNAWVIVLCQVLVQWTLLRPFIVCTRIYANVGSNTILYLVYYKWWLNNSIDCTCK